MKATVKPNIITVEVPEDSSAIAAIEADLLKRTFVVSYKHTPDIVYSFGFKQAAFLALLAEMSKAESAGEFAAVVKKKADTVVKRKPGEVIGKYLP